MAPTVVKLNSSKLNFAFFTEADLFSSSSFFLSHSFKGLLRTTSKFSAKTMDEFPMEAIELPAWDEEIRRGGLAVAVFKCEEQKQKINTTSVKMSDTYWFPKEAIFV